jgi:hypothetical protein
LIGRQKALKTEEHKLQREVENKKASTVEEAEEHKLQREVERQKASVMEKDVLKGDESFN